MSLTFSSTRISSMVTFTNVHIILLVTLSSIDEIAADAFQEGLRGTCRLAQAQPVGPETKFAVAALASTPTLATTCRCGTGEVCIGRKCIAACDPVKCPSFKCHPDGISCAPKIPSGVGGGSATSSGSSGSNSAGREGECFHASLRVQLSDGSAKHVEHLKVGDKVASVDERGTVTEADVIYLPHTPNNHLATFLNVTCSAENHSPKYSIKATHSHFLFTSSSHDTAFADSVAIPAGQIEKENLLWVTDFVKGEVHQCKVDAIEELQDHGIFSAYTTNGRLVVDGVVASSYAKRSGTLFDAGHHGTHAGVLLHRFAYRIGASDSHWFRQLVDNVLLPVFT